MENNTNSSTIVPEFYSYCSVDLSKALVELGFPVTEETKNFINNGIPLEVVQKWLMTQGIHIAPRIYLYHDINFNDEVSWECSIYIEYVAIYNIGKSMSYDDAMRLGIEESIKRLKELKGDGTKQHSA